MLDVRHGARLRPAVALDKISNASAAAIATEAARLAAASDDEQWTLFAAVIAIAVSTLRVGRR